MILQSVHLAVICVLSIWTRANAADCGDGQEEVDGQCCNLCPPGTYMKEFCSEQQTVCSPCQEGYYSDQYDMIDRCEKCHSCQQEYVEKCTPTANANCSCRSGFLCSNNVCSKCEENKCVTGEKLKMTASSSGIGLIIYSYQCEPRPMCPGNTYFDVKEDICKAHRESKDSTHLILGIGFALLSLIILVFIFNTCVKNLRKHKAYNNPTEVLPVSTNTTDFHLSKEESGLELIEKDDTKNSSVGLLHLLRDNERKVT